MDNTNLLNEKSLYFEQLSEQFEYRVYLVEEDFEFAKEQAEKFIQKEISEYIDDYPEYFRESVNEYNIQDYYTSYNDEKEESEEDVWYIDIDLSDFAEPYMKAKYEND